MTTCAQDLIHHTRPVGLKACVAFCGNVEYAEPRFDGISCLQDYAVLIQEEETSNLIQSWLYFRARLAGRSDIDQTFPHAKCSWQNVRTSAFPSLLTESYAFLKSMNSYVLSNCTPIFFFSIWWMQRIWSVVYLLRPNMMISNNFIYARINLERKIYDIIL
jgi:hypothetical protein